MSTIYDRMPAALQIRRLIAGLCRFQRVGFSVVVLGFAASLAAADPAKRMFNIEAKPATQSLTDYARQAHTQLGYDVDIVDDILTNAVVGEYDSAEALELLLEDTGLEAEHGERGIFIRRVAKREVGGEIEERTPPVAQTNSLRLAQASAAQVRAAMGQNQTSGRTATDSGEGEEKLPLEEIIVTGTNIRGIAPDSSPTRTFDREDIRISGAGTAQDFIQTLTANFGGGSNANIPSGTPNNPDSVFNGILQGTRGSSVNLRGLGSSSTLVLLNGRRLAPSSAIGDFVDISLIPASAIDRIEVLTDGASSIYGGDAVAGVVNFVLRDDFDGAETSFRYGTVTEGNLEEYRASITGGTSWNTGNALFAYEYFDQDNLSAADRTFSQDAALPQDLLPSQERHSLLLSATQELTPELALSSDLIFSKRRARQEFTDSTGSFLRSRPTSRNLNISAGGSWKISDSWYLDGSGTYSEIDNVTNVLGDFPRRRETNSNIWTTDAKASGILVRVPGGDVRIAIGGQYRSEALETRRIDTDMTERDADRNAYALFGEAFIPIVGRDNSLPGIERFEINVSGRFDDYSDFGSTINPKLGVLWSPLDNLHLRGTYSTSFKPPPLGRVGANDRQLTVIRTSLLNSLFGFDSADASLDDVVEIIAFGTGNDLDAENSRTFTAGADFRKQWTRHELAVSTTYFDSDYEDRLGSTPIPDSRNEFDAPNIAFNNPELFPDGTVIFFPSQNELQSLLEEADRLQIIAGADPTAAEIINFAAVIRNLARISVAGLDLDALYSIDSATGTLHFGLDVTYLMHYRQQGAATTLGIDEVDTLLNPVDLKLRARAGYARNGFATNLFVNYTDDYTIDNTAGSPDIGSWTTIDLSMSYNTQEKLRISLLSDTEIRLSVRNAFDQRPPRAPSFPISGIYGFDPTNASPLGRFISFELMKRF